MHIILTILYWLLTIYCAIQNCIHLYFSSVPSLFVVIVRAIYTYINKLSSNSITTKKKNISSYTYKSHFFLYTAKTYHFLSTIEQNIVFDLIYSVVYIGMRHRYTRLPYFCFFFVGPNEIKKNFNAGIRKGAPLCFKNCFKRNYFLCLMCLPLLNILSTTTKVYREYYCA